MTSRGHIMSITRHGTNRVDHGAIQRASNEETVELLFDSACHAERDQFLGVSNNVLLGQVSIQSEGAAREWSTVVIVIVIFIS